MLRGEGSLVALNNMGYCHTAQGASFLGAMHLFGGWRLAERRRTDIAGYKGKPGFRLGLNRQLAHHSSQILVSAGLVYTEWTLAAAFGVSRMLPSDQSLNGTSSGL